MRTLVFCTLILLLDLLRAELLMITTIMAPGSEVPYYLFKNKDWTKVGKGQLSPAGLRSQFLLGQDFSKRYQEFLVPELNTTNFDSAYHQDTVSVQSAYAFATGTFKIVRKKVLPFPDYDERLFSQAGHTFDLSEFTYDTPLPHGYIPVELEGTNDPDRVRITSNKCPKTSDVVKMANIDMQKNIEGAKFTDSLKKTIQSALTKYGFDKESPIFKSSDLRSCSQIGYFAMMDYLNSADEGFELDENDLTELRNCYSAYVASRFTDKDYASVMVSPFLQTLKQTFASRVKGETLARLNVFSVKIEVLYTLALAAGVAKSGCIFEDFYLQRNSPDCWKPTQQSASLTWELHRSDDSPDQYFVRTLMDGKPINFCRLDDAGSNIFDCRHEVFEHQIDTHIKRDFQDWCNPSDKQDQAAKNPKSRFWQFFSFFMLFLVTILGAIGYFGLAEIEKQRSVALLPDRPTEDMRASTATI